MKRFRIPRFIAVCGLLAVAGAALCIVGLVRISGVDDRIGDYPAVQAGHAHAVELDDPDTYVGYYESTGFGRRVRGGAASTASTPPLHAATGWMPAPARSRTRGS